MRRLAGMDERNCGHGRNSWVEAQTLQNAAKFAASER
jgi:hypothetical protein